VASPTPRVPPPPRALPITCFAAGHLALAFACLIPAVDPRSIAGFFFHPRMFAAVHSVTLGWITMSILGATYVVLPLAFQAKVRARWFDWVICMSALAGAVGVVGHFWIATYWGMVWSGGMLVFASIAMAWRVILALRGTKGAGAARAHVTVAYLNLSIAATLGSLLAVNRETPILPGSHVTDVFGHVHIAAVGWGTLMVFGVGYRLLPMYLPSKPVKGARPWVSLVLVETGVLGLALAFFFDPELTRIFAVLIVAGFLVFFSNVVSMLRNRVPAARKLVRPDVGMIQTGLALLCLLIATGIGLFLVFSDYLKTDWVMVYGVLGLIGFLGQIVLGIGMRLLPMYAWLGSWAASGYTTLPKPPYQTPVRVLQWGVLVTWAVGIPVLAYGLFAKEAFRVISAGGWILFAGTCLAAINTTRVLMHARATRRP